MGAPEGGGKYDLRFLEQEISAMKRSVGIVTRYMRIRSGRETVDR